MGFLLEFFFGPCMNHSAVDERHYQQYETPPSSRHHQQQRSRETYSSNGSYQGSYRSSSGHRPKPTTASSSKRMLSIPENEEAANNSNNNNGNLRRSASGSLRNSGNGHHKSSSKNNNNPSSLSGNTRQSKQSRDPSEISSLSDTFNNKRRSRTRRDDASVISQSLFETYQGYMGSEPDLDLDEQSAIRRSLKDSVPRVVKKKKKRPSPPPQPQPSQPNNGRSPLGNHISQTSNSNSKHRNSSDASQKTDLESWIEHGGAATTSSSRKSSTGTSLDVDNVTTISKASKNPYSVLGISHGASPKEIYSSYKRRLKETSQQHQQYDGGSERAFADVGNAYRRIYADIKRQEARRERKRVIVEAQQQPQQSQSQLQLQSSPQASSRSKKSRKSKRGRRRQQQQQQQQQSSESDEESDAKSRREGIESRLKDHSQLVHQLFANDNAGTSGSKRLTSGSSVTSRGQVMTLQNSVHSQSQSLSEMNLVPIEAGAANINERNETIQNSCFYLSLASSYLSGVGAFTNDPTAMYYLNTLRESTTATPSKNSSNGQSSVATVEMEIATLAPKEKQLTMNLALQLKRAIEAAVLLVHPDWAKSGMVGEEVQAFSDFLVYALDSDSVLGHWAIAVFDEASGFVDVYRGRHYGKVYPPTKVRSSGRDGRTREGGGGGSSSVKWRYKDCDEKTKRANTLTLRYIPGHYQPLLPELTKMYNERKRDQSRGRATSRYKRPMLEEILAVLERWNVLHVVTDGRA